jgi:hypothetical protein
MTVAGPEKVQCVGGWKHSEKISDTETKEEMDEGGGLA